MRWIMGKIKVPGISQIKLLKAATSTKFAAAEKPSTETLQIKGPGDSSFLVEMHDSTDAYQVRFLLENFTLGKHKCKYQESTIPEFEKSGYITTRPLRHFSECSKKAVMHSNTVGAEKLIPMRATRQFKFICRPENLMLTAMKLGALGYEIESTGVSYFPLRMVSLGKRDRITCDNFLRVMETLPNVVTVYDNIYR